MPAFAEFAEFAELKFNGLHAAARAKYCFALLFQLRSLVSLLQLSRVCIRRICDAHSDHHANVTQLIASRSH